MQVFRLDVDKEYHCGDVFSRWVDLAYGNSKLYYKVTISS